MIALNRPLLNKDYDPINVLKALTSIVFMCNLYVIFISNITRYFTLFTKGMFRQFSVRRDSRDLIR
jgi:hypothetical protein